MIGKCFSIYFRVLGCMVFFPRAFFRIIVNFLLFWLWVDCIVCCCRRRRRFFALFSDLVWFGLTAMIFLSGSEQNTQRKTEHVPLTTVNTNSPRHRRHRHRIVLLFSWASWCAYKNKGSKIRKRASEWKSLGNYVEPKIRGFKWKDNGSWAALCHYLTHSHRIWFRKRWSTFPCFQLIQVLSLAHSLNFIYHIISGDVTRVHFACGTMNIIAENAFSMMIMSFTIIITVCECIYTFLCM